MMRSKLRDRTRASNPRAGRSFLLIGLVACVAAGCGRPMSDPDPGVPIEIWIVDPVALNGGPAGPHETKVTFGYKATTKLTEDQEITITVQQTKGLLGEPNPPVYTLDHNVRTKTITLTTMPKATNPAHSETVTIVAHAAETQSSDDKHEPVKINE